MSLFSFLNRKAHREREERLRKARKDAYRQATMQLVRGDINLMTGNWIAQEEIDAELKDIAKDFVKVKH